MQGTRSRSRRREAFRLENSLFLGSTVKATSSTERHDIERSGRVQWRGQSPVAGRHVRPRSKEFSGGPALSVRYCGEATKSELGVYIIIRHVAVADGRHGDHRPPERVWDGLEEGVLGARLREVDGAREEHDTCKEEEG